jgi:hypothetical protein
MKIKVNLLARWPILVLGILISCSINSMAENVDGGGGGDVINSVPREMTFQGILKDSGGDPVADTTVDVTFRIFDDELSGNLEWNQSLGITTDGSGIFNAVLSNLNIPFDEVYWLEIQVDTEPNPMSPRQKLRLSAYAARTDTSDYALNSTPDSDWVISGDDLHSGVSGNVGIGTSTPTEKLHLVDTDTRALIQGGGNNVGIGMYFTGSGGRRYDIVSTGFGDGGAGRLKIKDITGGADRFVIDLNGNVYLGSESSPSLSAMGTGNVGIGTNSPTSKLDVNGDIYGSSDLDINGTGSFAGGINTFDVNTSQFQMAPGASSGYVLTSDGSGNGTWQATAGGSDSDWLISDTNMYSGVSGNVGIGTSNPSYPLHVSTTGDRAGYFTSSYPSLLNHTVHAQTTNVSAGDSKAVYGESIPADYYGFGGYFKGGYMGVYGSVSPTGSNSYYGLFGTVNGGTGYNYGVFGQATGSGNNYAVYYSGGLAGTGTKSCIVKTSQGPTLLYCQESPENWFEDFGDGRLENGTAHIDLDPLYLETVTIDDDHQMKVFVQLEGDCNGVYVSKGSNGFEVIELNKGTSNVPFSYRVVAKRKGFETRRLDYTAAAESDTYLYPERAAEIEKKRTE